MANDSKSASRRSDHHHDDSDCRGRGGGGDHRRDDGGDHGGDHRRGIDRDRDVCLDRPCNASVSLRIDLWVDCWRSVCLPRRAAAHSNGAHALEWLEDENDLQGDTIGDHDVEEDDDLQGGTSGDHDVKEEERIHGVERVECIHGVEGEECIHGVEEEECTVADESARNWQWSDGACDSFVRRGSQVSDIPDSVGSRKLRLLGPRPVLATLRVQYQEQIQVTQEDEVEQEEEEPLDLRMEQSLCIQQQLLRHRFLLSFNNGLGK